MGAGGWLGARKLAGRPFAGVSGGLAYYDDPKSLEAAVLSNPSRVAHGLDVLIAALKGLRDDINGQDQAQVAERLRQSFQAREAWLDERNEAGWLTEGHEPVKLPGLSEHITQLLFGGKIAEASRQPEQKRAGRN